MLMNFFTRAVLGTDFYHIIQWFLVYGILGWIVESVYMSICNRKLTNRGFTHGPICPIYGFGALTVYFLLRPFAGNLVLLYIMGCIVPTLLEYLTAQVMLFIFGEVWWDYNEKPFNYKGILCLESIIAWGFYTVGLFLFLQNAVERFVDSYSFEIGCVVSTFSIMLYMVDFSYSFYQAKKSDLPEGMEAFWTQIKEWF